MTTTIAGLLLALVSAAAINLGFLLQHRGVHGGTGGLRASASRALHSRVWLLGQAVGWAGFAAQIAAVSIAPLALVQSFAAGGLVLSVPLAAGLFAHRVSPRQAGAVALAATGLAILPVGLPHVHERIEEASLVITMVVVAAAGAGAVASRRASAQAIAGGLLYGVADAAIKAVSVRWSHAGAAALVSGWTAVAALGTLGGFLAFQASLRGGAAVPAISLMNVFAALVALVCGLLGFGESLGADPAAAAAHVIGIAVVLGCVPALAGAQEEIAAEAAWQGGSCRERKGLQPGARAG